MQITLQTEITHRRTCNACSMDRDADRGTYCECIEEDVPVEVVGEVSLDETSKSHPSDHIEVLSIIETETGMAWSPMEIDLLERNEMGAIHDALWSKYLETEPKMVLRKDVADLCDSMKEYVALALSSGTDVDRIKAMLEKAKEAIFSSESKQEEAVVS